MLRGDRGQAHSQDNFPTGMGWYGTLCSQASLFKYSPVKAGLGSQESPKDKTSQDSTEVLLGIHKLAAIRGRACQKPGDLVTLPQGRQDKTLGHREQNRGGQGIEGGRAKRRGTEADGGGHSRTEFLE